MPRAIPMESGERDRRVTVQQLAESAGGSHFPVGTWTDLADVWMSRSESKPSESMSNGQPVSRFETQWQTAYRADLDPVLVNVPKYRRLVYAGRAHDIVGAAQIGRKDGIELLTIASGRVTG